MKTTTFEFHGIPLMVFAGRLANLGGSLQARIKTDQSEYLIWIISGQVAKILGLKNPNNLDEAAWINHGKVAISSFQAQTGITDYHSKLGATIINSNVNILADYPFLSTLYLKTNNSSFESNEIITPSHLDQIKKGTFVRDIPAQTAEEKKSILSCLCHESTMQSANKIMGEAIENIQSHVMEGIKNLFGSNVMSNVKEDISAKIDDFKSHTINNIFETNIAGSTPYRFWLETIQKCASKNIPPDMVQKWMNKAISLLPADDKLTVDSL